MTKSPPIDKAKLSNVPLEERQLVWCLESPFPGRLCVYSCPDLNKSYIEVFWSEEDAIDLLRNGYWFVPPSGAAPIELSLEQVIQHSLEQGPDFLGDPCVGYVLMPEKKLVRTR